MALLLSWMLLVPQSQTTREISLPTTEDRGEEGLKGLFKWLTTVGVPVKSLRNRYDTLFDQSNYADTGNLLIISLPQRNNQRASEWLPLANWLEKGNSLLIMAAEFHKPAWSEGSRWKKQLNPLGEAFGWKIKTRSNKSESSEDISEQRNNNLSDDLKNLAETLNTIKPEPMTLKPDAKLPVMRGIVHLQGDSAVLFRQKNTHFFAGDKNLPTISLAQIIDDQATTPKTAIYLLPTGQGNIYLSLMPDLFSIEQLGQADNAHFIINLINNNLGHNGKVIFDDYHFGLSELYDKTQFFNDNRLHNTLLFIAALWLVYVVGHTNRLAPVRQHVPLPAEIDKVKAMSGFFAGRINQRTLARELVKHLMIDIQLKYHLGNEQKAGLWLRQNPALSHLDTTLLSQAPSGMRVAINELNKNINAIRKRLL